MSSNPAAWRSRRLATVAFTTARGLPIEATSDPESPIVSDFYTAYDEAFVLPNEKELLPGFIAGLALNGGAAYERLGARYGEFAECVLVVRESPCAPVIAGANLLAWPTLVPEPRLVLNLNYVFVTRGARRSGLFGRLLDGLGEIASAFFEARAPATLPCLIFLEQNDPDRMDPADYALDTAHTGLDQRERVRIWARRGVRRIDFPYVQPALSATQEPEPHLLYGVLGAEGEQLDACLLHDHLQRYFAISILKGDDLTHHPVALAQLDALQQRCRAGRPVALSDVAQPGRARA